MGKNNPIWASSRPAAGSYDDWAADLERDETYETCPVCLGMLPDIDDGDGFCSLCGCDLRYERGDSEVDRG
uniref:Uncharacterized protein n=1 Tax=viral metagenome TaxID=1070528 RepID=A0A6M3JQ06_9ZZZZ